MIDKNDLKKSPYGISDAMTENTISKIAKKAINTHLLSDDRPTAVFFDLSRFETHANELMHAFPAHTLHAIALKANPVINILKVAAKIGLGAECASMGELLIAKKAGFKPNTIVYDSPTKTKNEILYALQEGVHLNIDNEQELNLIHTLLKQEKQFQKSPLGIRINPELSLKDYNQPFSEAEEKTITGLKMSKFGLPISQAEIILKSNDHYKEMITGLHLHVGSQRCPVEMMINGIKRVLELAELLNCQYGYHISTIDIGGGLAVQYRESDRVIRFSDYSNHLFSQLPQLKNYKIITEFGRSVFAEMAVVISKVEYTKLVNDENNNKLNIALTQIGGDMFVRTAYMDWYHDILLLDRDGSVKKGEPFPQSIAGPLCFSGDFLGKERNLPAIEPGNWIVICDAGAYTFSMWSHYNSRMFPPIYGFDQDFALSILHRGQPVEDTASFWE